LEQALALRPDVIFLDIRMPGLSGLDVAESLAEDWPDGPLPLIVFVTAYDQYALRAFEHAAVDYVLKPVEPERLAVTCRRLQASLAARANTTTTELPRDLIAALAALRDAADGSGIAGRPSAADWSAAARTAAVPASPPAGSKLRVLQASLGATIHMVPVADVLYFEAADKYIKVVTAAREYLIRMPLRRLVQQLDPDEFWQVHRAVVVRAAAIATAVHAETGKVELTLKAHPARLVASRLYAHLFRPM
jgi:DNA-binding LytR/AlgR family response regulator